MAKLSQKQTTPKSQNDYANLFILLANFLAMYFYHSAKIILPLFYGAVALMEWPKIASE